MQNRNSKAENGTSASLEQNGLLSAALSVEGNGLIAEFMGAEYQKDWSNGIYKKPIPNYKFTIAPTEHASYNWSPEGLQYNSSWEWLMPVVEKIQKVFHWDSENDKYISVEDFGIVYTRRYPTDMNVTRICICTKLNGAMSEFHHIRKESKSKIESVWLAVVEFIEWYNVNTAAVGSR